MAETVASFVFDKLSAFLCEEGRLLGGIRDDVQLIRDELEHMRAFLKVAEDKEDDDPRLQVWINQVREAAYDAEDVVDEFVSRFARLRATGFYGFVRTTFKSIKSLRGRHRVASEARSIRSRIMNISETRRRYQSEYGESWVQKTRRYSRDDALLVEEAKLVGIEKPKQHFISQLLDGDSQLKVISVVGMGGLGKTTLVKKMVDDLDIRRHFPARAWVTVSQRCDFQELLKNLILQLHKEIKKPVPQMFQSMTCVELKEFLKNFLQQVRYAIVFDDVWDIEFWNEIKFALPENSCGNRVILTTRIADVASAPFIDSQGYVYKMKPLCFEESWTLFCNKVFRNGCCPAHLKNVAQGILQKCEGLPLAVVAISGLLALKDLGSVNEWEMVRRSMGAELEGIGKLDRIKKILDLSYNDLPSYLRTCLLYLSIFPEDFEIECSALIQLWIAERFVEQREGVMVEDVARGYLRELVNRSLIQVTEMLYEGKPWRCRIHDLLREFILSKSRKQNLVTIVDRKHTWWPTEKARRLVIHNSSFFPIINNTQESQHHYCFNHIRSIITFGSIEPPISKILVSEVLSSSKLLKVLDLGNAQTFEEIPKEIFNLFHLKHLSLFGTRVKTVPKSIGKLQNLEYLDLGESKVRELPTEILKLTKLNHLVVYAPVDPTDHDCGFHGFKPPPRIGGLLSLQSLSAVDAAPDNEETIVVKEIGKLRLLRKLAITNLRKEDGKELCSSLANLTDLQGLIISSTGKDDEVIDLNHDHPQSSVSYSSSFLQSLGMLALRGRLEKMPEWIVRLQGLVRIDLIRSGLKEDPLESLQDLPNLVRLYLSQAYQGEGLCFRAGRFLKLKELWIRRMERLRWMRVEEGAMPCIQKLILEEVPLLEELPVGIQHLTHLQEVQLADMSSKLVKKLENQIKDIAHIPEIAIYVWIDGEWKPRHLWGEKKS